MGGVFYPQCAVLLRVRWEDFGDTHQESLQKVYELPILARNVTVNINDYSHADTFELEVEYKHFPFDPRAIRACGVTVFMDNMGKLYDPDNSMRQVAPKRENAVFMGFADEESIHFDDTHRTVKLEGRDFTGLLVDRKYPHGTVNVEKPLDQVLMEILSGLPETKELVLDNRVVLLPGERLPVLSKFWSERDKLSGRVNVPANKTYWDVIQDVVGRAGLIAYMELDKLVLSQPRVLYDKGRPAVFVYGRNLKSLEFKRKVGRMKNFNVAVRSLNVASKEVLLAKIPEEASAEWSKRTGIPNKEMVVQTLKPDGTPVDVTKGSGGNGAQSQPEVAPYMSFRVPDVSSKAQLITIGERIYEEISRQQIEGSLETHDMEVPRAAIHDGRLHDVSRFDVLKLRVGAPIRIEIDQGDLQGISRIADRSERVRFLVARGYNAKVAAAFAESMGRYNPVFYTKAVTYRMDADQGFECKVEFLNFIELPKALAGTGGA